MGSYCVGENHAPVYWNVKLKQRALELLAHDSVLGVARRGKTFRPVEANTGDRAADTFVLREGSAFYVAIFNYRLTSETKTVDLARVGASPRQKCHITELWSGTALTVQGTLSTILEGSQSKLFLLQP
ncbi:MAG TPA: hypothetical protein VE734_05685 [Terriglobales bacterium]|nr:hypothetical protein [Terriglobales bacterium]